MTRIAFGSASIPALFSALRRHPPIVQRFDHLNLPRSEPRGREPIEGIDLAPAQSCRAEATGLTTCGETKEGVPKILQGRRDGRNGKLIFQFCPPFVGSGTGEKAL